MAEQKDNDVRLPDAQDADVENQKSQEEKDRATVTLWIGRFEKAKNFREPYMKKNLRMYKLYRAYRDATNYAYQTSLMPSTGFEVIETIKPRIVSSEMKVNIYPTKKEDVGNESIDKWDDLVEYGLQVMNFEELKIQWVNAMLMYGNGTAQITWTGEDPYMEVVDNALLYMDPLATNRGRDARWLIKQIPNKNKATLKKEEERRGENKLYIDGWESKIEETQVRSDDPRRDRTAINTLKMGQIRDGIVKNNAQDANDAQGGERSADKDVAERGIELLECWDFVEQKLVVIGNRQVVMRDEPNPYEKVNNGRIFVDLPDISLNWEYYAMGHLEPVETTVHEIADSRNQAMDDIVLSLDPIIKIRKGGGYKAKDFKHAPGAIWELAKADDVVIERGPEISQQWMSKDALLNKEIQNALGMSEYLGGKPTSSQEPSSKVELLLNQSNIRFALILRQLEIAITEVVNIMIQMNQEFLTEDKAMRILGKNFRFADFTMSDKEIIVDAKVDITPIKEKTPEQEAKEVFDLYETLVVNDPLEEGADEEDRYLFKVKKQTLQQLMLEKLGYDEYIDRLAPKVRKPKVAPEIPQEAKLTENPEIPGPADIVPLEGQDTQVIPEAPAQGEEGVLAKLRGGLASLFTPK